MSHKCPIAGCQAVVVRSKLMCPAHWHMVPAALQSAVYNWYRKAPQSRMHLAAIQAAIKAVNESTFLEAHGD